MNFKYVYYILITSLFLSAGCANIVPPSGGDKDVLPPKLVNISPADSQRNVRTAKIRLDFDEYVTVADAMNQVIVSPLLPVRATVTSLNKHVTISFPDSVLQENTTYHVTYGNAIRDIHEGNIYKGGGYIFSTGSYFDSLSLSGNVVNAMTGLPDTSATILLYAAKDGDSAILRKKPMYASHTKSDGSFLFQGLPKKEFRVFALRDKNNSLTFDDRTEWTGFLDSTVFPDAGMVHKPELRIFPPAIPDTGKVTAEAENKGGKPRLMAVGTSLPYMVVTDTSDIRRRTQDINKPLQILFARKPGAIHKDKIFLSSDSAGVTVESPVRIKEDSSGKEIEILVPWTENSVYTLRLQKGFAKDSSGNDLMPGRFHFRTKKDEDYAKLTINVPGKYYGAGYLLQVSNTTDTVYTQPVTDSVVRLLRIAPGSYKLHIIVDKNKNGRWDTGDLFAKKQPEMVIPYSQVILLKPGWENQVDFEPQQPEKKSPEKSPGALPH